MEQLLFISFPLVIPSLLLPHAPRPSLLPWLCLRREQPVTVHMLITPLGLDWIKPIICPSSDSPDRWVHYGWQLLFVRKQNRYLLPPVQLLPELNLLVYFLHD